MEKLGTVLVVDGDNESRSRITHALAERGFLVESFDTGVAALERMATSSNGTSVGIVVTDLTLPDMGGRALCRKIGESHRHVSAVYLTSTVPSPVVEGSRVFSKSLPDPERFCDFVWSLLKTSVFVASVAELRAGQLAQAESSRSCRLNVDERFAALRTPGLSAVAQQDWEQAPRAVRWGMTAMATAIGSLVVALGGMGWWVLSDVRQKAHAVTPVQEQVRTEIVPAIRDLRAGQLRMEVSVAEILRRTPPSPTIQRGRVP